MLVNNPHLHENLVLSLFTTDKFLSLSYLYESLPVYYKLFPISNASEIPDIINIETSSQKHFSVNKEIINYAYISGEDISDSFINTLRETTGINFTGFNPFEKIPVTEKISSSTKLQKRIHTFAAAAGIAYRLG